MIRPFSFVLPCTILRTSTARPVNTKTAFHIRITIQKRLVLAFDTRGLPRLKDLNKTREKSGIIELVLDIIIIIHEVDKGKLLFSF